MVEKHDALYDEDRHQQSAHRKDPVHKSIVTHCKPTRPP